MIISCDFCKKLFKKKKSHIKNTNFCCRKCYGQWQSENRRGKNNSMYGRKRLDLIERNKSIEHIEKVRKSLMGHVISEETRKKIGDANRGRKPTIEQLKTLRTNWIGRKHSEETKKKMSEWQRGEKSHRWKGGISKLNKLIRGLMEYNDWRIKVYEKDKYICQMPGCNHRDHCLVAHHVKTFSNIIKENNISSTDDARDCKELWNIDNGITLCDDCHSKTKWKEKKFEKLFNEIIKINYEKI